MSVENARERVIRSAGDEPWTTLEEEIATLIDEVQAEVGCKYEEEFQSSCFDKIKRHDTYRWSQRACVPCQAEARLAAKRSLTTG